MGQKIYKVRTKCINGVESTNIFFPFDGKLDAWQDGKGDRV
jgi:hypothetical protein